MLQSSTGLNDRKPARAQASAGAFGAASTARDDRGSSAAVEGAASRHEAIVRDMVCLLILREMSYLVSTARELSRQLKMPPSLLETKLQLLTQAGLVRRVRTSDGEDGRYAFTGRGFDFLSVAVPILRAQCRDRCSAALPGPSVFDGITACPDCSEVIATPLLPRS